MAVRTASVSSTEARPLGFRILPPILSSVIGHLRALTFEFSNTTPDANPSKAGRGGYPTVLKLGEGDFGIGIDHGLLIDPAHTL